MEISKEYITLPIGEIKPYENNPRINDDAVADVVESIKQCGELDPIEVDENNVILSGHTRLKAYNQLGHDSISVLRITGLTEPQKRKYRLLTNKTGEVAAWDFDKLGLELEGLDFDGFDFGFDVDLPSLEEDDQKEVVEDDYDEEPPTEPKAKLGDLWQLGDHRLICGDSTDVNVIDRLMDGVKADCVFTDPPYGVSANGGRGDTKKKLKMQDIANDDLREEDLCNFLQSSFAIMPIKEGASIYICYPWATQEEFTKAIKNCGYTLQNCIIWRKNVFGLNGFKGYRPQYEMIYFCSKTDYQWYGDLAQSNVWDFNRSTEHIGGHPTVKPIELIAKALKNSSKKEDCIYDGFGGSGSTLIACEQLNRKCYMVELDPKYVSVILQRYINFKGSDEDVFLLKDGKKIPYSEVE